MITEEKFIGFSIIALAVSTGLIMGQRIDELFFGGQTAIHYILVLLISGVVMILLFERILPTPKQNVSRPKASKHQLRIKAEGLLVFMTVLCIEIIIASYVFYQGLLNDINRLSEMMYLTMLSLIMIHGIIAVFRPNTFLPIWRLFVNHSSASDRELLHLIKDEGLAMIVISFILTLEGQITALI
jgi:hypothetical protein